MNQQRQPDEMPQTQAPDPGRRQFITYLLGFSVVATVVGVATPIAGYLWPPIRSSSDTGGRVPVGTTTEIPVGHGEVVAVDDKPVVVVNTEQGGIKAYSAICTHLGCISKWDPQRQVILCPCHDGRFNPVNGAVISGPPPTPLPAYQVSVEGETIFVSDSQA